MSIRVSFPVKIEISCNKQWLRDCSEPVTVEGRAYIAEEIDIDSVPSIHSVLDGVTYDIPEGWSRNFSEHLCPKCTKAK
jgi:hypothetical protein